MKNILPQSYMTNNEGIDFNVHRNEQTIPSEMATNETSLGSIELAPTVRNTELNSTLIGQRLICYQRQYTCVVMRRQSNIIPVGQTPDCTKHLSETGGER